MIESSSFLFPDLPTAWPDGMKVVPLNEWQKMGFDTHSLIADPLFVDPEHDDYRLKPESPAFKLGFQPIEVTRIGMRNGDGD